MGSELGSGARGWTRHLFANAYLARLNNPEPTFRLFGPEDAQRALQQSEHAVDALRVRTQHPDTLVARWGVEADIGKVEIEGNEYSTLGQAGIKYLGICPAPETFFEHCLHIVAGTAKQYFSIARKILVQLEPNGHPLGYAGMGTIRSRTSSAA